jgi:DNA polymerase
MNFLTLDFESFYSESFTLNDLSTEHYCRDPRFEAHCVALKWGDQKPFWVPQDQLVQRLNKIDWNNTAVICWHAAFDCFILNYTYGIKPKFIICPMSMARMMLGNHVRVSLDSVRAHFNLPPKNTPYNLFKGKHWNEMTTDVQHQVGEGACDECNSIWKIFNTFMQQGFIKEELRIVDQTIRLFTEPMLRADIKMLADLWERENAAKETRRIALNIDNAELRSADKFAALLIAEGIEIETKEGKNGPIPAFAAKDDFMRNLLEHESDRVRALAEARLGIKSTLLQTRAATLGWMARRGEGGEIGNGPMPVYLNFCGARTLRDSGGDGSNWQNFKRGSDIRKAIMAPPGYLLAPIDASQIECRVLNTLANQEDVVERFKNGHDPYIPIASEFYGRPITRNDTLERGTGKQAELSCGYGCGPPKFRDTARLGIYGPPVDLTIDQAGKFVDLYRRSHRQVVDYWTEGNFCLRRMNEGIDYDWGIFKVRNKRIYLECRPLIYDTLEWYIDPEKGDKYWRVKTRKGWEKLYGAKLIQNLCEAVSRLIVFQAGLRIQAKGHRILCRTHDELLILLANDGQQEYHLQECITEFEKTPDWLPGIPLAAEGSLGERYSK